MKSPHNWGFIGTYIFYKLLMCHTVAAQMYEFSYTENPPNCVGGIREVFYCLVIASLLLALLLNTSRSSLLLRINCLVSTVVTHS
jgi:hypothetical protein